MSATLRANEAGYVFRERYPEREDVYARFDAASALVRAAAPFRRNVPYGKHPRETFDLFEPCSGAPLLVFIHGGYWQSLDKDRYSFVAGALAREGFAVALPNYPLAPEVPLEAIVESIGRCIPAIIGAMQAPPLFWMVSGHSAGGHLAAMGALNAPSRLPPLAACVPISGIFDVTPIVGTSLNAALRLDIGRATALSPIRRSPSSCHLAAVVGAEETQDFLEQSRQFTSHWGTSGAAARLKALPGRNHYTILCDLLEEQSEIVRHIVQAAEAFSGR